MVFFLSKLGPFPLLGVQPRYYRTGLAVLRAGSYRAKLPLVFCIFYRLACPTFPYDTMRPRPVGNGGRLCTVKGDKARKMTIMACEDEESTKTHSKEAKLA